MQVRCWIRIRISTKKNTLRKVSHINLNDKENTPLFTSESLPFFYYPHRNEKLYSCER